ncbi:MAG: FMN-binding protein [Candidatus Izemoplasmataceae bacterium]
MKKILFISVFMVFLLTACGTEEPGVEYPVDEYFNASITSATIDGDTVDMVIVSGGFAGDITIDVTVTNGEITAFTVTDHSESEDWGKIIIDEEALTNAIIGSSSVSEIDVNDYDNIDAEGSATAGTTAEALVDAASAALSHYDDLME